MTEDQNHHSCRTNSSALAQPTLPTTFDHLNRNINPKDCN
ncbi:hypothetical protein FPSE_01767 [Fusarium pseudograminearum CS3096]|uniref:Uncharacterized protein n=1 Tax=Fusarium pseudograminearum (strain CS3096) TaxID=1028729 RepID=K3W2V4_FUSPC|nr:hypothetical protein FPSE_01767 [Fusarium pseudograminearum CS3096]EKJ78305.1 hypothetical protein FPSE_01767 [Fusarium pseudograminearum CS3096]